MIAFAGKARYRFLMFSTPQDILQEFESRGLPSNFCHIPFTTMILEPDGKVGSCRMKGSEFPVGEIRKQTLQEIWNGETIRAWRREFLSGDVKNCRNEVRHKACNLCPTYNWLLPETVAAEVQERAPIRLVLNLNGRCNLECRMCHIWQKPNGLYDELGLWGEIEELLPGVREIELLSGEPFIQGDTYRLIELVSRVNPECRWTLTTNAHWKLNDTIRGALDKIHVRNLVVSMDSLNPETYSTIRRRGTLEVVQANLDRLIEYDESRALRGMPRLGLKINFLVQKDNWSELGDFHEYGKRKGVEIFRTFMNEPFEHSLLSLPEANREEILGTYLDRLTSEQLESSVRILLPLMDSVAPLARADFLLQLKKRLAA